MRDLEDVKVGDELYISSHRTFGTSGKFSTVERITKTQVITKYEKFRKSDGYLVGRGAWDSTSARLATDQDHLDMADRKARNNAVAKIKRMRFKNISTATLTAIAEMLPEDES